MSKRVLRGLGDLALLAGILWGLRVLSAPRRATPPAEPAPIPVPAAGGACEGELVDVTDILRRWGWGVT